jgi:fumarate hydratase class II
MNANEVIANRACELLSAERGDSGRVHPNDHVNMAQSTNDTIHVAIHIAAAEAIVHDLAPKLIEIETVLNQKASDWKAIVKSGRTHLQDAVPMRLGQEVGGWAGATLGGGSNDFGPTPESPSHAALWQCRRRHRLASASTQFSSL